MENVEFTLEELSGLVGRPVTDKSDMVKHYEQLKSYTGSERIQEINKKAEAIKVVATWMADAGINPEKINPLEAGSVLKALESKTDVASAAVKSDNDNEQILKNKVRKSGKLNDQLELAKIFLKKI